MCGRCVAGVGEMAQASLGGHGAKAEVGKS